jgi:CRISPR-associated exonuclease Cas4
MAGRSVRFISAGDVEKFSYCPLSWWLSEEKEVSSERLELGIKEHERLGKSLWKIEAGERAARESERLVFWWAIAATFIAFVGMAVLPYDEALTISEILGITALIWILAATYFLFKATKSKIHSTVVTYERIVLVFAIVAVVIAVYSVAFLFEDPRLAVVLEFVAIVWLIGASFFLYRTLRSTEIAESLRKEFRVKGKIEYIDVDDSKSFKSEKYGLVGKPDYVIKLGENVIPVEEKKGRSPRGPLFSHILQIAAYCILIEEASGRPPPYGLLKYPAHDHEIEYNEDLKKLLIQKLAEMRKTMVTGEAHRNHNRPGKCRYCSRRDVCLEKLT